MDRRPNLPPDRLKAQVRSIVVNVTRMPDSMPILGSSARERSRGSFIYSTTFSTAVTMMFTIEIGINHFQASVWS